MPISYHQPRWGEFCCDVLNSESTGAGVSFAIQIEDGKPIELSLPNVYDAFANLPG
jgi:hypothetical protein